MPKKLVHAAAMTVLSCSLACGAEEPAVPPPPAASADPTPVEQSIPQPAVPTAPVPDGQTLSPAIAQPLATWQQDYGYYWYRPEAVFPGTNAGLHPRYPYYSYRRPWYPAGPASVNVTIIW